jgi:hypothetical protein
MPAGILGIRLPSLINPVIISKAVRLLFLLKLARRPTGLELRRVELIKDRFSPWLRAYDLYITHYNNSNEVLNPALLAIPLPEDKY